jgi:hypothetical protein
MLIDMHAHTSGISRCCKIAAEDMVRVAKSGGMDGVVLTNHYDENYVKDGDALGFARRYVEEYEYTRACGEQIGCRVFFGIELTPLFCFGVHLLIYGVTPEFLLENPRLYEEEHQALYEKVKRADGILVQAHPWRGRDRLLDTRYLDGIEISCHPLYEGTHLRALADIAAENELFLTCGGDFHNDTHRPTCGVYLPNGIENAEMLAEYFIGTEDVRMRVQEVDERRTHDVTFRRRVGIVADAYEEET